MIMKSNETNGILWNCMNNEATCFVEEAFGTTSIVKNILGYTNGKKDKQSNLQYILINSSSMLSDVHTNNFYYNTGGLDGNEMTMQLIHVLTSYELLGASILGIVSGGGGGGG